ncbi:hypothetical protein J5N97_002510 [Dioscorea zingiberensis]|uniref:Uncharacterized protein n=1 Tax=Dioscorea zingiberensis TaxID=325984 RepID=A0A9D5HPF9_9LILI|nr:hypothetical protein J5N97_002510 [Dioscorea zingiberensis]
MEWKRKCTEGIPDRPKRIRMLESWLPSIMEEEEEAQKMNVSCHEASIVKTETILATPSNEEKESVLYNATEEPLLQPSCLSNISLKISPELLAGLKSRVFWPRNPYLMVVAGAQIDNTSTCSAIIPWMPSNVIKPPIASHESRSAVDPMEVEQGEGASMEVEEPKEQTAYHGLDGKEFQQWQQQQCMPPQLQQTTLPAFLWPQQ